MNPTRNSNYLAGSTRQAFPPRTTAQFGVRPLTVSRFRFALCFDGIRRGKSLAISFPAPAHSRRSARRSHSRAASLSVPPRRRLGPTDMCGPRTFSPSKINSNSPATAFLLTEHPRSRICLPLKHSRAPPPRAPSSEPLRRAGSHQGIISPAGDIWSARHHAHRVLDATPAASAGFRRAKIPSRAGYDCPLLFLDIVRHCLQRDPQRPWTVVELPTAESRLRCFSASPRRPPPAFFRACRHSGSPGASPLPRARKRHRSASLASAKNELRAADSVQCRQGRQFIRKPSRPEATATRPRYDLVQPHLQRPPLLPPLPNSITFRSAS